MLLLPKFFELFEVCPPAREFFRVYVVGGGVSFLLSKSVRGILWSDGVGPFMAIPEAVDARASLCHVRM